jgi:hypothetical protein
LHTPLAHLGPPLPLALALRLPISDIGAALEKLMQSSSSVLQFQFQFLKT